jgi:hypothetical protein
MADEKKCKYCSMMIPADAKICPCCRKTLGWTLPAKIVLGIIVIGIIIPLMSKKEQTSQNKEATTPKVNEETKTQESPKLTLENYDFITKEYGNKFVVGTVKNNTNKEYKYAQISFALFDSSGAQVGTSWANITNLESGGTWKFEALAYAKDAVTAKFKGITAY